MRNSEFQRLIEFGGSDINQNKYFDFERDRIILSTDLYELLDREVIENGEVYQLKEWLQTIVT